MARVAGGEAVYEAAEHWVDAALRRDDSLFTPGEPIWSLANLTDFHERFAGQPDDSKDPFFTKFERQLHGSPPQTPPTCLLKSCMFSYLIVHPRELSAADTKREHIRQSIALV